MLADFLLGVVCVGGVLYLFEIAMKRAFHVGLGGRVF